MQTNAVRGMTPAEQRIEDEMAEAGISRALSHVDLRRNANQFFCGCSDGSHARQLFDLHANACGLTVEEIDKGNGLLHPIMLNGGALLLSPTCALSRLECLPHDIVGISHFAYAMLMKGQHGQVSLYTHTNCSAARLIGLSQYDSYDELMRAKYRLRRVFDRTMFTGTFGAYKLLCRQVDGQIVRESRHVHKTSWEKWLNQPAQNKRHDEWHEYKRQVDEHGLGRDFTLDVFDQLRKRLHEMHPQAVANAPSPSHERAHHHPHVHAIESKTVYCAT